jgi:zinc/manganese transport system permease protein
MTGDAGIPWLGDFIFYATFGIVVVSSVVLVGVLLVFSFLIIPAAIGVLYRNRLLHQLITGWIVGTFASAVGLGLSYIFDLPTGAALVCTFGATLALAGACYPFICEEISHSLFRLVRILRWAFFVGSAGSGAMLAAAPQMDQPIFDLLEYCLPSARNLYFTKAEARIYQEAETYDWRYRSEQERLNALETKSRASEGIFDDARVQKISSYLKTYAEMRAGEEFTKREVRSRARKRVRFLWGGAAIILALVLMPGIWSRRFNALGGRLLPTMIPSRRHRH